MGRRSSAQQWPFYRSVIGWFLPWAMMALVAGGAVFFVVDALGPETTRRPVRALGATSSPTPEETPTDAAPATPSPTPTLAQRPSPRPSSSPQPKKTRSAPELLTEGVTVQVLNGTGAPAADDDMADRLARLGFEVIAIDGSSKEYPQTTVFWSLPEAQEAAERLARRFGWLAAAKPENLSTTVDLHVVVGLDEA